VTSDWPQLIGAARELDAAGERDRAVAAWEALAAEPAPGGVRVLVHDGAGAARLRRYWDNTDAVDLDAAIRWWRSAAALVGTDEKVDRAVANNLGRALETRYDDRGDIGDLNDAIAGYEGAGPDTAPVRAHLATALRKRFDAQGGVPDLDRAITLLAGATEPDEVRELAGAVLDRHDQTADPADLTKAVQLLTGLLDNSDLAAEELSAGRNQLANVLLVRFDRGGDGADLDEAVRLFELSVRATTDPVRRALTESNLAGALLTCWNSHGGVEFLDRAIAQYTRAAEAAGLSDRQLLGIRNNYAAALDERFHVTGALHDLDRAIEIYTEVVDGTPPGSPDRAGRLNNLAIALRTRHLRTRGLLPGADDDLRAALSRHREALGATGEWSTERAALINNLGNGLRTAFDAFADLDDLRAAVSCFEQAVELTPAASPDRAQYLNNLGAGLAQWGDETGDVSAIRRAAEANREAVESTSPEVAELPRYELNLANVLSELADRTAAEATERYRDSCRRAVTIAPEDALAAAANWSEWAGGHRRWVEVAEAYGIGAQALALLIEAQTMRAHKESWLRDAQGLSARAMVANVMLGRPVAAAVAAEQGRALLLAEALAVTGEAAGPATPR
jgi:tetratricopeptide (TPR) repeat protein